MSARELDAVRKFALSLSERDRTTLASDLVASLDGPGDRDVSAAWDMEIYRRINEIEASAATLVDLEAVLARARNRLNAD